MKRCGFCKRTGFFGFRRRHPLIGRDFFRCKDRAACIERYERAQKITWYRETHGDRAIMQRGPHGLESGSLAMDAYSQIAAEQMLGQLGPYT